MENVLALLVATLILVPIPGPKVSLVVARSPLYGNKTSRTLFARAGVGAGVGLALARRDL